MDIQGRETIESIQNKFIHSSFKKLIESFLFIFCLDPFAIYRANNVRAKFTIYRSQELQLPVVRIRRWQSLVRSSIVIIMYYLTAKYTISGTLLIVSSLSTKKYRSDLNSSSSAKNISVALDALSNYRKSNMKQAIDLLGNPFSSMSGTAMMFDICLAGSVFYVYIILPRIYRHVLIDSPHLRFMLNPSHEIRRIDLMIEQYLKQISMESSNNKLVMAQLKQIFTLRPINSTVNWYRRLYKQAIVMTTSMFMGILISDLFGYNYLYQLLKGNLCKSNNLSHCNYSDVFSIQHSIGFLELILGRWAGVVISVFFLVNIAVNLTCQVSMARSVKRELCQCLEVISNVIDRVRNSHSYFVDCKQIQSASYMREMHLQDLHDTPRYASVLEDKGQQLNVELSLLRTFVKVVVTCDEIKKIANNVRQFVESVSILASCVIGAIFVVSLTAGFETKLIPLIWYAIVWIGLNLILIGCAFVHSHSIEPEKIAWSILAELRIYQDLASQIRELSSYQMSSGLLDLLARRWYKLVGGYSLSDRGYSINPYGFRITFRQVIRMNFFVISLVSLRQLL